MSDPATTAALTDAIKQLAASVQANTRLNELLIKAMPARVEAELTGRSVRTVYRQRRQRTLSRQ